MFHAVCTILLADFLTGLVHWWEDRYGNPDWPILGPLVIEPNITHHNDPMHFTKSNFLERNYQPLGLSIIFSLLSWLIGMPSLVTAAIAIAGFGNEVHAWAHRTRQDNGAVISLLHDMGLIQCPRQHGTHHRKPYSTHFCTITNWLNPILEATCFWPGVEWILAVIGIQVFVERSDARDK